MRMALLNEHGRLIARVRYIVRVRTLLSLSVSAKFKKMAPFCNLASCDFTGRTRYAGSVSPRTSSACAPKDPTYLQVQYYNNEVTTKGLPK